MRKETDMKNKLLKRMVAATLALAMVMSVGAVGTFAASGTGTGAPKIEDVDYEGRGQVDVDFYGKVKYRNAKITVKDTAGRNYTARITAKDNDEVDFKVIGYKAGKTYRFTISGIKKSAASKYTSVKGSFKIPQAKTVIIEDIDYDAEDREVSVEFKGKVQWYKAKVSIKDSKGNEYAVRIIEKDSDEMEIRTKSLKQGGRYSYRISGVKAAGASSYITKTGSFTAYDD